MEKLFVLDANALISYFKEVFSEEPTISNSALKIIDKGFNNYDLVKLSIPSIAFVEIFDNFCISDEDTQKIRYEIILPIFEMPNIEVRELDKEVLENIILLDDNIVNLENHDKIVLSTAMVLDSPLITSDNNIMEYVQKDRVIERIIS